MTAKRDKSLPIIPRNYEKAKQALSIVKQGIPIAEAARIHGVDVKCVQKWVRRGIQK